MPRTDRRDWPGSWHHVTNRGVAKRAMFECSRDFRFFLSLVARAVRRGEIEVHCYCLMVNHYHLLLRSPKGGIHLAMGRIQQVYSRRFNKIRQRDGSLVRGRFFSKPANSLAYRYALVRYIDWNPCNAGLARHPTGYPFGSAAHYNRRSGPPWLERSWVAALVKGRLGQHSYLPSTYRRIFYRLPDDVTDIIETRMRSPVGEDPLDNLKAACSAKIQDWLVKNARNEEGNASSMPVMSLRRLAEVVKVEGEEAWVVKRGHHLRDARPVALAGLGRDLCGASLAQLQQILCYSVPVISNLCHLHTRELKKGGEYSRRVADLTKKALHSWSGI